MNTAEARGHPDAGDALLTPADLRLWGQRYEIVSARASAEDADSELRAARATRELLFRLFRQRVQRRPLSSADREQLAREAMEAYGAAELVSSANDELGWQWNGSDLATVRRRVVISALGLLGEPPTNRLKQCPGTRCGWFFLDKTKSANRRWCSMRECGQQEKTTRRRERRHNGSCSRRG